MLVFYFLAAIAALFTLQKHPSRHSSAITLPHVGIRPFVAAPGLWHAQGLRGDDRGGSGMRKGRGRRSFTGLHRPRRPPWAPPPALYRRRAAPGGPRTPTHRPSQTRPPRKPRATPAS